MPIRGAGDASTARAVRGIAAGSTQSLKVQAFRMLETLSQCNAVPPGSGELSTTRVALAPFFLRQARRPAGPDRPLPGAAYYRRLRQPHHP
jgi:hypothetical protein